MKDKKSLNLYFSYYEWGCAFFHTFRSRLDFPSCDFFLPFHHFSTGLLPFIEIFYRCPLLQRVASPSLVLWVKKFFPCPFFHLWLFIFLPCRNIYIYICIYEVRYNSLCFMASAFWAPVTNAFPTLKLKNLPTFCPSICMVSFFVYVNILIRGDVSCCVGWELNQLHVYFFPVLLNDQSLFPLTQMSHFMLNSRVYLSSSLGFFSSSTAPFSFIY